MSLQTAERVSFKDPSDNVIYQRHLLAYQEAKRYLQGRLIEVGIGEGYGIDLLAPSVDRYDAIDKYETNLSRLATQDKVHFQKMSVPPIEFENDLFDCAVSFQVIEHIEDDEGFVKELARVLKRDAPLVLTTPNKPMSLTRNPWHVREYLYKELEDLLRRHFSKVEMYGVTGNEKVMNYYQRNKESVQKITRWDFLNLQYRLPRKMLQYPYDFMNRLNRRKLLSSNQNLVTDISVDDFTLSTQTKNAFDFFCVAYK